MTQNIACVQRTVLNFAMNGSNGQRTVQRTNERSTNGSNTKGTVTNGSTNERTVNERFIHQTNGNERFNVQTNGNERFKLGRGSRGTLRLNFRD